MWRPRPFASLTVAAILLMCGCTNQEEVSVGTNPSNESSVPAPRALVDIASYGEEDYAGSLRAVAEKGVPRLELVWWKAFDGPEALAVSEYGAVVVDLDGSVTLLDLATGNERWRSEVYDGEFSGAVTAWVASGVVNVVAPFGGRYALNEADGGVTDPSPGDAPSSAAMQHDPRVRIVEDLGSLELFDGDGSLAAEVVADSFVDPVPYGVRVDDYTVIGDAAGNVVCLRWVEPA